MSESLDSRSMPSRKAVVAKVLLWVVGISVLGAATGYVAYQVSPWPGALLIRIPFDRQAIRLNRALEKHIPKGVTALLNEQQYDPVPRDAYLDVFYPSGIDGIAKAMPTIVWVHGGAWISGRKDYTARTSRSSRRAAIVLSRSANQTVAFLLAYPEIARAAALLMRIPFDRQAIRLNRALEKHVAS